jgi:hypothetical protein
VYTPEQVTRAIVVLGFQLNDDGTLKPGLMKRLDAAIELYHQNAVPIIVSGWFAINIPTLSQYYEALLMKQYLHETYGDNLPVFMEPDSKSVPENILFTRIRFPSLTEFTVVAGKEFADRAAFFAHMIFAESAHATIYPCDDGTSDPAHQRRLLGDAMCTLKDMTPGDLSYLQPVWTAEGRLDSAWNGFRTAHHECEYWKRKELHPGLDYRVS